MAVDRVFGAFMSRTGTRISLISWGVAILVASSFAQAPQLRPGMSVMRPVPRRTGVAVPAPAAATPTPVTVLPAPATLAQSPSVPPQVSYQAGMLTIVAKNSSLGDILREVHKTTGAVIDVPGNATERVVGQIGPGPARDVLASLLNGTSFNYVLVGSMSDPTTLATVMLTTKTGGGAVQNNAAVFQPPQQYEQQSLMAPGTGPGGPVVQQPANDEEADAEEEKDEEDPAEEDQAAQNGATTSPDGSQPPNAGPKTPEQILQMLRQRPGAQINPGQPVMQQPNQQQPPDDNNNN
jgi:hypothetical protein